MKQLFLMILMLSIALTLSAQPTMPSISYIKVDQFGYKENSTKVAVISDPQVGFNNDLTFSPGGMYQLREWYTDAVVFSADIQQWNGGAVHEQSGDAGWWFDFSSVTTAGEYYIYDATNNVRSHRFVINDDVYAQVLKSAMRVFYYNRCGIAKQNPYAQSPWTDATSFTQDAQARDVFNKTNGNLEKDLSGGWYDAGDFNKYITFAESTMHDLLWAYIENPTVFTDDWDIPESGNGIPDIIDELKWELDFFKKMNNPDGSTHLKMGSQDYSDNTQTPPSLNTDTRFYGPTCSSAEIVAAGVFAQAAIVFEQFPALSAYAQDMEARAETTWAYVLPKINMNNLDTTCDLGEIISGDADVPANNQLYSALKAAIYLYDLTGKAKYQTYITNNLSNTEQVGNGYWFTYSSGLNDALLHYSTLTGVSTAERNLIRNSFANFVTGTANTVLFGMSNIDLYRSYMPDNQYHWGSNKIKGTFGQTSLLLEKYNIVPANNASYLQKAEEHVHYFHGLNPLGYTYLTNMYHLGAENSVNQMYHQWFGDNSDWDDARTSLYGPAPGYVTGGPNASTSVPLAPPFGQPEQKSYLDFNTSSTAAPSWEISEPAIYYQASYVRLLAAFSSAPGPCLAIGTNCDDGEPKTTNDVEDGFCSCKGDCPVIGTPCDDGDPLTNNDQENGACLCEGVFGEIITPECEIVTNGDFASDSNFWFPWGTTTINQANGQVTLTNNSGANPWDCAFAQEPVTYIGGTNYTMTFTASASANRTLTVKLGLGDGSAVYNGNVNLTTTMTAFSIPFTNSMVSTSSGTVEFQLGGNTADVTIDNVSIVADDCTNCPAAGTACDDGNPSTINDQENGDCLCVGTPEDPVSCEVVTNGSFYTDTDSWFNWGTTVINYNNGEVTLTDNSGVNPWDCAFAQDPVSYTSGTNYTLTFNAAASSNRDLIIKIGLGDVGQNAIHNETVSLTSTMTSYSIPFTNNLSSTTSGTIEFQLGGNTADVILDEISIREVGCSDCPNGEIEFLTNGRFNTDISGWAFWGCTPAQVGGEAHLLSITQGNAEWDAGFANQNVNYETGETYQISFEASSDVNRDVFLKISTLGGATAYLYEQIAVTTTMSTYSFSFIMTEPSVTNGTVEFFIGNDTDNVYIDNVSVTNGDCNPNGSCEQLLYVGGTTSAFEYQAELELTSDALIVAPDVVDFHAGDFIELMENFEVQQGAAFHAHIAGCN